MSSVDPGDDNERKGGDTSGHVVDPKDAEHVRRVLSNASRDIQRQMDELTTNLNGSIERTNSDALRAVTQAAAQAAQIDLGAERFRTQLRSSVERIYKVDFADLFTAMRRSVPPNWWDLDRGWKLGPLLELAEAGFPTAWLPRGSLLQELVDTAKEDQLEFFNKHKNSLVEDCEVLLSVASSAELQEIVSPLREATVAAKQEQFYCAQALSASIVDTMLRRIIEPKKISGYYKRVKDEINERRDEGTLAELRWTVTHLPVVQALETFDPSKGAPVPAVFNRHASAHAVGHIQYSPANALLALCIAVSIVREAQEVISKLEQGND